MLQVKVVVATGRVTRLHVMQVRVMRFSMNDTLGAILAVLVLWILVRLLGGASLLTGRNVRVSPGMIYSVHSMFPHVSPAAIHYDLLQTGSAEVTCDKILRDGNLPAVRLRLLTSLPLGSVFLKLLLQRHARQPAYKLPLPQRQNPLLHRPSLHP